MLKFATLGAALAAIFANPINSNQLAALPKTEQQLQPAIASKLVASEASLNLTSSQTAFRTSERINAAQTEARSNPTALVLGLAIGGVGAVAIAAGVKNAKSMVSSPTYPSSSLNFRPSSQTGTVRVEQVSRKLRQRLMLLLHEDRDAANRLLSRVKLNNPHRSVDWCADKVIYDLKRDRGGY